MKVCIKGRELYRIVQSLLKPRNGPLHNPVARLTSKPIIVHPIPHKVLPFCAFLVLVERTIACRDEVMPSRSVYFLSPHLPMQYSLLGTVQGYPSLAEEDLQPPEEAQVQVEPHSHPAILIVGGAG